MGIVDDYLKGITPAQFNEFKRIRSIVRSVAGDTEESISYGIPTFMYKGKFLLYFGAFKNHMSVFPGSEMTEKLKEKLNGYKLSKGTIQFTEEKPIKTEILEEIIRNRMSVINN